MLEQYAGRPSYAVPLNVSIDREAREYLSAITGDKNMGRVVSRLILEERARAEERQRIAAQLAQQGGVAELRAP